MFKAKEVIRTELAPEPIGPYNQAIKANGFVFVSGQIPLDPKTGELVSDLVEEQTRQVLDCLKGVLEAADSSLGQVVKTTMYLANMNDFVTANKVYATYFQGNDAPARVTVEVSRLPKDVKVEIDAIAIG